LRNVRAEGSTEDVVEEFGAVFWTFAIVGTIVVTVEFVKSVRKLRRRAPVGEPGAAPSALEARQEAVAYAGELAQLLEVAETEADLLRQEVGDVAADRLLAATTDARGALDALNVALGQTSEVDVVSPGPTATAAANRVEGALLAARRSAENLAEMRAAVRALVSGDGSAGVD
jgi:hypothetical protein